MIFAGTDDIVPSVHDPEQDLRSGKAVIDRIADQIIEDALYFVAVAADHQVGIGLDPARQIFFAHHRTEFKNDLLKQTLDIHPGHLQRNMSEIKSGDFKKFVDQILQPLGAVESDGKIFLTKLGRNLLLLLQKRQIADD